MKNNTAAELDGLVAVVFKNGDERLLISVGMRYMQLSKNSKRMENRNNRT